MISDELKTIIENLNGRGQMDFIEAATEQQIADYEKKHNFSFPPKFREWLLFSDGGECYLPVGVQFYGVAHKPLIDVNDNSKPDDSYVVIGSLPNGDPVLIKNGEDKISVYNLEEGKIEEDEVYDDFFVFLNILYDYLGIGE